MQWSENTSLVFRFSGGEGLSRNGKHSSHLIYFLGKENTNDTEVSEIEIQFSFQPVDYYKTRLFLNTEVTI